MSGMGGAARAVPDAPALIVHGRAVSHAEFDERARRVAGLLLNAGVSPRDRIAVLARNRPEIIEVVAGALRARIVPVPVNALLTQSEVAYVLEDSGARWVFADRAVEPLPGIERIVTFGDAYERSLHEASPADIDDFVLGRPMHYTSGTTGRPKGVWVEPSAPEAAARRSEEFRSRWGLAGDELHLVCSPLTHSAPLRFSLRTLEAGGAAVILDRFDPRAVLAAIELFAVTSTFMVPTHLERIVALGRDGLRRHDLSSVRLLAHAGAPLRRATKEQVVAAFPAGSVWEFYGSTEGGATRISTAEWTRKPGSVGIPDPGARVIVRDESGRELPSGEVGEVWIQDPDAERFEYWGDPAATAGAWRGDSFSVGDLGYLDSDGYLFLTGRRHDTIITGGVNVQPQEVEEVLAAHPQVAEVAVYGAPDDEWGQQVCAAVVPAAGAAADPEELRGWARERLAGFKCPRRIVIVDQLARTPTGKIIRREPEGAARATAFLANSPGAREQGHTKREE